MIRPTVASLIQYAPDTSLQSRVVHRDNARYHGGARTSPILGIITHLTDGATWDGAESWLNRPDAEPGHRASYHYGIDRDGQIIRMLHPRVVAWHAGRSTWPTLPSVGHSLNHCTIGIAFACRCGTDAHPATGEDAELTSEQLASGLWLHRTLMRQHGIPAVHVLGHREVSPRRKFDPLPRILGMDQWRLTLDEWD